MALVIKSWSVKSQPQPNEPYVRIVARQSGLMSFLMSLIGIDPTTTLVINQHRIEFEQGSLAGFVRHMTPFEHISASYYGRHKPWKTALFFMFMTMMLSSAFFALHFIVGILFFFAGIGGSILYYYLNRELLIGFTEDSSYNMAITFKRSVIEGQEIDDNALRNIIAIFEFLMRTSNTGLAAVEMGGAPVNERMAGPAPTHVKEITGAAPTNSACPACGAAVVPGDKFCGVCGHKM